jgi:uncharacterized surface protein with fasciclin (FAS1) repeats
MGGVRARVCLKVSRRRKKCPLLLTLSSAACLCAATTAPKDIVATAAASPDLSTLVKAVTAAGLVDTLESPGPFTVLAPTDLAFAELPNGTLAHLLEPANIKELVSVHTYHVISGNTPSTDLKLVKLDCAYIC